MSLDVLLERRFALVLRGRGSEFPTAMHLSMMRDEPRLVEVPILYARWISSVPSVVVPVEAPDVPSELDATEDEPGEIPEAHTELVNPGRLLPPPR